MIIKVTQENIDKGIPCSACNCAVSLGAREAIPNNKSVGASGRNLFINGRSFLLPSHVIKFIFDFDRKLPVEPMEFEINYEQKS